MTQYGYALMDGDELACIDYRIHVFWHKSLAEDFMKKRGLQGFTIKRVSIATSTTKEQN